MNLEKQIYTLNSEKELKILLNLIRLLFIILISKYFEVIKF